MSACSVYKKSSLNYYFQTVEMAQRHRLSSEGLIIPSQNEQKYSPPSLQLLTLLSWLQIVLHYRGGSFIVQHAIYSHFHSTALCVAATLLPVLVNSEHRLTLISLLGQPEY